MTIIQPTIKTGILSVGVAHFKYDGIHYVSADSIKWRATTDLSKLRGADMKRFMGVTLPAQLPKVTIIINNEVKNRLI